MKAAIVTGANGFVGAAVTRELVQNGYEVYAIGHKNHFDRLEEDVPVHCVSCDMEEIDSLPDKLPKRSYDLFYHLAWSGINGRERGEASIQLKNIAWVVNSVRIAKSLCCRRFIGAGSIMEDESMISLSCPETVSPGNVYGVGKLAAHIMGLVKAQACGIDFVWAKLTNTYGPGEISSRLISQSIQTCLAGRAPKFTEGKQLYDFVYIDDVARAFRLIGEKGKNSHEYVIGSAHARPLKEFLLELQEVVSPGDSFEFGAIPFYGPSLSRKMLDCSATEQDTGFRARVSFAEGCRRTVAWWKMGQ